MQCDDRQLDNQLDTVAIEQVLCPVTAQSGNQSSATVSSGGGDDLVAAVEQVPCLVTAQSGHQPSAAAQCGTSGDQLAPPEPVPCSSGNQSTTVTFKDIMPFPKRDRPATRKRKKPPSYELTSAETITFVRAANCKAKIPTRERSKAKKDKDKKKSVSAAVAKGSKKKKLSKFKENNVEDGTPCCVCGKKYNEPPADEWQQCANCKLWFHDSCGPGETELCYYCLG